MSSVQYVSDKERVQILDLHSKGMGRNAIASKLHRSRSTVGRIIAQGQHKPKQGRRRGARYYVKPEEIALAQDLWNKRWSIARIAKKLKRNGDTVSKMVNNGYTSLQVDLKIKNTPAPAPTATQMQTSDLIDYEVLSVRLGKKTKAEAFEAIRTLSVKVDPKVQREIDTLRKTLTTVQSNYAALRAKQSATSAETLSIKHEAKKALGSAERYEKELRRLLAENNENVSNLNTARAELAIANERLRMLEIQKENGSEGPLFTMTNGNGSNG